MTSFTHLIWQLDATTKTNEKVAALRQYFENSEPRDAVWAIYLLMGRRLKRLLGVRLLAQWATSEVNMSDWLFEECYERVGDLAETISLILPPSVKSPMYSLADLIEDVLLPMQTMDEAQKRESVISLWKTVDQRQCFVLGKLMTGGFRIGVSKKLVTRAISEYSAIDAPTIAHRLMGDWQPTESFYQSLIREDDGEAAISRPFPFFLANPLKGKAPDLGDINDWVIEWKWDGVRAQVIRRQEQTFVWSRGEDLVTEQFPEILEAMQTAPDGTVLDGEILGWDKDANRPLPFHQLQRRIGRKKVGKKLLTEVPVVLLPFDLLELAGQDIRQEPLTSRQQQLSEWLESDPHPAVQPPPKVGVTNWDEAVEARERSKELRAEGLMLKRAASPYQVGRPVGDWWKWKVDPYTVDAVLIYAQRGHGRRASLYTDYTFAVWNQGELVPFAKAYTGLTDVEIRKVDAFVRRNTNERFGPVRSVKPQLVFELAFENIQSSPRHKSGVAVRFPRIIRWRHDKDIDAADQLSTLLDLIEE